MSDIILATDLRSGTRLTGVSLQVGAGEALAVVGSRGSGKSTLVRILAGQLSPDGGSASVLGVAVSDPACRRLVGVAGEAWGLYERLTVTQNLAAFARVWGLGAQRISEVLKRLELTPLAGRPAGRLTAGEQARLRLARALLHDPPALLLDEPAGDIDRESADIISFAIGDEVEHGKAVLLTTFGARHTLECATRICYLEEGQLLEATPAPAPAPDPVPASVAVTAPPPPPHRPEAQIRHIAARRDGRLLLFRPEEISMAYALEKAVYIQTAGGPCAVTQTLADLEERLAGEGFYRCHRAYLVNLASIRELAAWTRDSYSLILRDGTEVPLSKHRAQELRARLNI